MALICAVFSPVKADEGMWLLQLMQEQNLADRMKAQGMKMDVTDIYSADKVTLKDAVGIFGRGCTGEIISPNGLILTNHHCGYDAIQQHSSVDHDYLTNGFWAKSYQEELPTPGLTFKFVERIVDVTDLVNEDIKKKKVTEAESFGTKYLKELADKQLKKSDLKGKPGISALALPFYAGNKYYLFFIKTYSDVRMVAAPPSSIGKFGGETDNWMWPRHTCDFSMFRIYADKDGNPTEEYKERAAQGEEIPDYFAEGTAGRRLCHDYGIPRKHKPLFDGKRSAFADGRYEYTADYSKRSAFGRFA